MTDTNAAANAGAAGQAAQAVGGAAGHTTDTHGQALEGSIKQATDINTEETLALLQSLAAKAGIFNSDLTAANAKRTADQAQSTDLLTTVGDTNHRQVLNQLTTQALQNAIETHNMVAKQAVRHADIAIDGQWNPVQQGAGDTLTARAVSIDDVSLKAIGAVVAAAVANALASKSA